MILLVATWTGLPDDPEFLLYVAELSLRATARCCLSFART